MVKIRIVSGLNDRQSKMEFNEIEKEKSQSGSVSMVLPSK